MARAMWKGQLQLGDQQLDVKLYSAVEDRTIRFHLLHDKDRAPVEQHIVRKDTGKDVSKDDIRKAFPLSRGTAVILEPEDLESSPHPNRAASRSRASLRPRCLAINGTTGRTFSVRTRTTANTLHSPMHSIARTSSALRAGSCARNAMWAR